MDERMVEGRVCIVTGAGRGIGREHALMLSAHGAKVIVNDLGASRDGSGDDAGPAQQVVDEITRVAGISRGSFYTYFPSKRDALLASGADSLSAATDVIASLAELGVDFDVADLQRWVSTYFDLLEEHGSFAFAWTQAAQEDEEIRKAGMKGHLELCRKLGSALATLGGKRSRDPTELGLAVFSMLERSWAYAQLYDGTLDKTSLQRTMARMLAATIETP